MLRHSATSLSPYLPIVQPLAGVLWIVVFTSIYGRSPIITIFEVLQTSTMGSETSAVD